MFGNLDCLKHSFIKYVMGCVRESTPIFIVLFESPSMHSDEEFLRLKMCFLTCLGVTGLKENFFTVCFDSQLFQKVFKAEVGSPVIEESSFWMSSIFL